MAAMLQGLRWNRKNNNDTVTLFGPRIEEKWSVGYVDMRIRTTRMVVQRNVQWGMMQGKLGQRCLHAKQGHVEGGGKEKDDDMRASSTEGSQSSSGHDGRRLQLISNRIVMALRRIKREELKSNLQEKLEMFGFDGLAAYGLLNTCYYTLAFTIAGFHYNINSDLTLRKFIELSALVWAGSQITKGLRLTTALLISPVAGRVLTFLQNSFSLRHRSLALMLLIVLCFSFAFLFFCTSIFLLNGIQYALLQLKSPGVVVA